MTDDDTLVVVMVSSVAPQGSYPATPTPVRPVLLPYSLDAGLGAVYGKSDKAPRSRATPSTLRTFKPPSSMPWAYRWTHGNLAYFPPDLGKPLRPFRMIHYRFNYQPGKLRILHTIQGESNRCWCSYWGLAEPFPALSLVGFQPATPFWRRASEAERISRATTRACRPVP